MCALESLQFNHYLMFFFFIQTMMNSSFAKRFAGAKEAEKRIGIPAVKCAASVPVLSNFKSFSALPKENFSSVAVTAPGFLKSSTTRATSKSDVMKSPNEKLQLYLEQAVRPSTRKTYLSYWRRFNEFCKSNSLPIQGAESISLFLIQLAENSENRASALSAKHAIKYFLKLKYPFKKSKTDSYFVSRIIKSISKKWGKPVKKAKRITSEMVSKLVLNLLRTKSFKDERTAMFILLQFICMGRYEEIAKLEKSFIEFVQDGHLKIYFPSAKNFDVWDAKTCWAAGNSGGLIDPVALLRKYLNKLSGQVKWLFPSFRLGKGQTPVFIDKPVSYSNMLNLLKEALSSIGERGEEFSLHGVRTGSLSEVANSDKKIPKSDIRRHGRWKSQEMVDHYHELSLDKKLAPSRALQIYDK